MKRSREPLGHLGASNSMSGSGDSSEASMPGGNKRGNHQQQQQQQQHVNNPSPNSAREIEERGPFRALLAAGGVGWARTASGAVSAAAEGRSGFACRCNPAKLRLFVEKELVHDRAKREEFIESLREFMSGPAQSLRRALLPLDCSDQWANRGVFGGGSSIVAAAVSSSIASGAGYGTSVNAVHESLVKVLLRVDCIQPQVIDMLLEKLPEIVAQEEEDEGNGSFSQDLPRLVLNQVRFLDHLVDSASLTRKLLECIAILPVSLQREMISYLPEVVEDGDHPAVVETLQSLQESEPSLLVAVLDALGNLSLHPSLLSDITGDALGLLESAEPATLPVLLRFLLETATVDTAEAVVREVREKLRLCPTGAGGGGGGSNQGVDASMDDDEETEAPWMANDAKGSMDDSSRSSGDALTLEALRQGLRLRADLAASFLKAIGKTEGSQGHSVVDVWVLFCLHANQDTSKKVVTLFRRKISLGHFTEALMADALHGRAGALHALFPSLLGITDALVSTGALATRRYGASMYRVMFLEFSELYHRQEVVGALLTHAGAGSEAEADCALTALSALANSTDAGGGLRPFAAFIRGLLDYMEGFTHNQVRVVFRILCAMALPASKGTSTGSRETSSSARGGELDDVHIFIRKHVAQSQMALKCIGIIGAVAFVEFQSKLGSAGGGVSMSQESAAGSSLGDYGAGAGADGAGEAQRTLAMLLNHCRSSQEGKAFLYDELALSAGSGALSGDALDTLIDMLSSPLEHDFMNVIGDDTEDEESGEARAPTKGNGGGGLGGEDGRFPGEVFGGAVKTRAFGDLNQDLESTSEVLILPLLASDDQQSRMKVDSLCPLFSLLASCYRSHSAGSMEQVGLTLGASIILADSHTIDNVSLLDDAHKEAVVSAHFAACNWIRELMNAFVLEPDHDTKSKLVLRLDHLCRLEADLLYMMKRYPEFRLPGQRGAVNGHSSLHPAKRSSTTATGGDGGDAAGLGTESSKGKGKGKAKQPAPKKAKKTEGEISELVRAALRKAMRPLSPEAVLVLGFPGMLIKTRNTQAETVSVESVRVSLRGVHLMLQEMHGHLKKSLAPAKAVNPAFARLRESQSGSGGGGSGGGAGTSARPARPAHEILGMYQRGGVFKSLWNLLEMVGNSMRGVEESIGIISSSLDDEDMLLPCLEMTLKILSILCGSSEMLGSASGRVLLHRCVEDAFSADGTERSAGEGDRQEDDADAFALCFDKLEDFASTVQQLPLAVQLVQVMEAVATARIRYLSAIALDAPTSTAQGRDGGGAAAGLFPHHKLSSLCLMLLQRDWGGGDMKFVYKRSTLGILVRTYLRWAKDPLLAAEVLASEVMTLLLETGECLGPAEGYPTLTAASFIHYHTPLLQALVTCWKDRTDFCACPRVPTDALLMRAGRIVLMFRLVVLLTKGNPTLARRPVLVSTLKEGKKMMQAFLRTLSVFEDAFQANQQEVIGIFADLQMATRHMQTLCAYGKELGDASMSKEAPIVKKLLEEFILRVRFLANSNDCLGAFEVGRLTNRDLDGNALAAAVSSDEESDDDSADAGSSSTKRARSATGGAGEEDGSDDGSDSDDESDENDNDQNQQQNDWTETESEGR